MTLYASVFPTPVHEVVLAVDQRGAVKHLDFAGKTSSAELLARLARKGALELDAARCAPAQGQVMEYFAGRRTAFELALDGDGTPFQKLVWAALCAIPFGATLSYGALARRLGRPQASRAVGRANGTNPISLLVPCHRVIGADGSLTGYGGGLDVKRALLDLEQGRTSLFPGAMPLRSAATPPRSPAAGAPARS
jgi:methylated-DNA-[protein]-cysteine S-methyltransferase